MDLCLKISLRGASISGYWKDPSRDSYRIPYLGEREKAGGGVCPGCLFSLEASEMVSEGGLHKDSLCVFTVVADLAELSPLSPPVCRVLGVGTVCFGRLEGLRGFMEG